VRGVIVDRIEITIELSVELFAKWSFGAEPTCRASVGDDGPVLRLVCFVSLPGAGNQLSGNPTNSLLKNPPFTCNFNLRELV
jgi:hypothetical protein